MPDLSDSDVNFLVLHTLRCLGFTTLDRIAEATGLSASDAQSELIDLGVDKLVSHVPGDFGGWGLTDAGRAADAERAAAERDKAGARAAVAAAFETFLVLNPELLDLCTAWQTRTVDGVMTPNDHTDPGYDARVLDRLGDFHDRALAVCGELTAALPRFGRYEHRLGTALARATAGEGRFVADDTSSYHVIWFQLHEDLLVTQGIPRH
ncbi:hypothetical protein AMIS_41170 [Actinoplanes missouriensis 431]|uniref:Uncharacterized protein n=1 Tax=Actinoplanes missouriensis (strain ATCC 14538 / DSM 43046 / CBS 188.64 / JCM 3121 / NBRC 102363 / NCIMB 12654 / NRRL B-3342 / UNCC 431) TaxID=512565 RepID=I0H8K0_ACTM4|nr:hypothetical protein [Actinoplanes missouriensis]BAL89337.1 hypothetical protein AMIS_41170 [Actinoplanes missouriensis 431]